MLFFFWFFSFLFCLDHTPAHHVMGFSHCNMHPGQQPAKVVQVGGCLGFSTPTKLSVTSRVMVEGGGILLVT